MNGRHVARDEDAPHRGAALSSSGVPGVSVRRLFAVLMLAALVVGPGCADGADERAPSAPHPSTSVLPDFSGVWLPDGRKNAGQWPKDPPFTPTMIAARADYAAKYFPVDKELDDENTSCIPYGMLNTMLGIAQYPFEIVATSRQVTIFMEIFGSVRRIYLDGRPAPADQLPSRMGFSTGHWEGQRLVVETTHLISGDEGSARPGSPAQRIVERFSVVPDTQYGKELVDEITVHDPRVYTQPITVTMRYKWSPDLQVGEYLCQQDIWDQNKAGHTSEIPWRK